MRGRLRCLTSECVLEAVCCFARVTYSWWCRILRQEQDLDVFVTRSWSGALSDSSDGDSQEDVDEATES